jgi:phospholipid/cholesterol/gamma-HCH transport system substrate-binding protein
LPASRSARHRLSLNPQTFFADATISMRNDVAVPVDSTILIFRGLLGGTFVEVQPGGALENLGTGRRDRGYPGRGQPDHLLMKFAGGGAKRDAADPTATP